MRNANQQGGLQGWRRQQGHLIHTALHRGDQTATGTQDDAADTLRRVPTLHRASRTVPAVNASAFNVYPVQGLIGH